MKKYIIIISIIIGTFFPLYIVGHFTNSFRFFSSSENPSNYPTFKPGQRIIASNLLRPKRFNFICYQAEAENKRSEIWMHRLCGLEGDKIEIKQGILYVNDRNSDSILVLSHEYFFLPAEFDKLEKLYKYRNFEVQYFGEDSVLTYASDKILEKNLIKAHIKIIPKDSVDMLISKKYEHNWNADNFGPIIVPKGSYFVLGDNRLRSVDSRYIGFVEKKKYIATVLFH